MSAVSQNTLEVPVTITHYRAQETTGGGGGNRSFAVQKGKSNFYQGTGTPNEDLALKMIGMPAEYRSACENPAFTYTSRGTTDNGDPLGEIQFYKARGWFQWNPDSGPKCYWRGTNWSDKSDCPIEMTAGNGSMIGILSEMPHESYEPAAEELPPTFKCGSFRVLSF